MCAWWIWQEEGAIQKRSFVIATYALCGFSNFGSVRSPHP